jgi:hypothetical protein
VADVLTLRQLNRTLLARHHLLERVAMVPEAMVEHLVGMQAQIPLAPYTGLWSRIAHFDAVATGQLVEARQLVRLPVMRGTLHLVTAADALVMRPVIQPVLTRLVEGNSYGRGVEGIDVDELVAVGRSLVEERPMPISELGRNLRERWPQYEAMSLAYSVQYRTGLVQVPPRGVWGRTGTPRLTTTTAFVGREESTDTAPDELVMRYIAAFGPVSVRDAQAWSGLQGLAPVFERLRPRLRTFRDEHGRELFDITDHAVYADADTPTPVRFLPDYDNVCLGHADRARIVSEEDRKRAGIGTAVLLVDGFARATWKLQREGKSAAAVVDEFEPFSKREWLAIEEEGHALLAFLAPDATPDVRFVID